MKVTTEQMAAVVAEASKSMSDPNYSALIVGDFVASQAPLTQYVSAHDAELGGAEGIVSVIFHAGLLGKAVERALGMGLPHIDFQDLDQAARGDAKKRLASGQPALWGYIESNIESAEQRRVLALVALALATPLGSGSGD